MRLAGKGLIDRTTTIGFRFDGVNYIGHAGDTLASALLANGVRLMGRSFKYHRPRGVYTAGSEEPNALVEILEEGQQTPNVRATVQELYQGLDARSQNRFPNLKFDFMAVNDLVSPWLSAGFYYKTFMWPRKFWERLYEPLIRRAAGLGSLSGEHDRAQYEQAFAFCDLLIIGAGPAGLMAALTAGRAGADVMLCDEDFNMGGQLLSGSGTIKGLPAPEWAAQTLAELKTLPNVRLMARTTVTGVYDHGTYSALERVALHVAPDAQAPRECFWRIHARQAVLAAGALERGIAFDNNDRPGIMLASALRSYIGRYGVAPGQNITLFANNDSARQAARDAMAAGIKVAAIIDSRPGASAVEDCQVYLGAQVIDTKGRKGLRQITVQHKDGTSLIETDCLGVSGGWNPVLHLTCHMNNRPIWNDQIAAFVPAPDAVKGLTPVGSAAGLMSTAQCLASGIQGAQQALAVLGITAPALPVPDAEDDPYHITPLWQVPHKGRAWLDFANDVTVKDVKLAAQENYAGVEHMKRYTTQGMAPDQGKNSNVAALAVLADATGRDIAQTGTTTFRPPYTPTSIAAIGAAGRGAGFAPQRLMTSHEACLQRNAPMIEAGLWYRPGYFPRPNEATWQDSCNREALMVRSQVGVCDVSTLGKIDIQGRDAGRFLDFVYINTFSTLPTGRVRYGAMLREDGHVLDDGTTARLGEHHFLMTTTTAAAGQVMRHLDFVHQAFCPDFDLRFISATESWAQFAIAGPKARILLHNIADMPVDLPFMGCITAPIHGVPARIFRISFSGEECYEIAVPTRYGAALWRDICARAETMSGGAYGMEALNVLRIEKGLLTHAEMHGRTTAFDLGLQGMMSQKKDYIGKAASTRPGLMDDRRERLVGLKALDHAQITAGSHLFVQGSALTPDQDQGYITSACHSPTLQRSLALGFLRGGPARYGEKIRAVDRLRGIDVLCEVCPPVFHDPEGNKLRA